MSTVIETQSDIVPRLEAAAERVQKAHKAAAGVIFGQDQVIERTLITILAGGHALLIGVPGLAKTLLVDTLGKVLGLPAGFHGGVEEVWEVGQRLRTGGDAASLAHQVTVAAGTFRNRVPPRGGLGFEQVRAVEFFLGHARRGDDLIRLGAGGEERFGGVGVAAENGGERGRQCDNREVFHNLFLSFSRGEPFAALDGLPHPGWNHSNIFHSCSSVSIRG